MAAAAFITEPAYLDAQFQKDIILELELYLTGKIERKCLNRLKKSIQKKRNLLFERMVQHGLYEKKKDYFIGLSDIPYRPQRNAKHLESLIKKQKTKNTDYSEFQQTSLYFNNATKFPTTQCGAPKDRTSNSGFCYYTYESDTLDLNKQLLWTFGGDTDFDCVAGKIYKYLTKYKDFSGLYCVWSGNKSLHIHTEWNIRHLAPSRFGGNKNPTANEVRDEMLRDGMQHCWDIIGDEIKNLIKQETGDNAVFDDALRQPEAYRRLSWALRYFKKGESKYYSKDFLVPQIELWSCAKIKQSGKEIDYLHQHQLFFDYLHNKKVAAQKAILNLPPFQQHYEKEFIEYVKDAILGHVGGVYPEPVAVKHNNLTGIEISFRNSATDIKPSSVMKGDYKGILIAGNKHGLTNCSLPFTANELWLKFKDVYVEHPFADIKLPVIAKGPFKKILSGQAYTHQDVRNAIADLLPEIFNHPGYKRVAVLTQEGAGKTTSLLMGIPKIASNPFDFVALASATYDQAEAHCHAFNLLTKQPLLKNFIGVVLPSFSWVYEHVCTVKKYSGTSYMDSNYTTLLAAVYDSDPNAVNQLETWKKNFWDTIAQSGLDPKHPKTPVFFTVHDNIHKWHRSISTKLWLEKNFKKEFVNWKKNKNWSCNLKPLNFSYVIYDELKRDDLRWQHTKDEVDFYKKVQTEQKKSGDNWRQAFQTIKNKVGTEMTFDEILKISEANYQQKDTVTAKSANEQIGVNNTAKSPYKGTEKIYVKERLWWKQSGTNKVLDTSVEEESISPSSAYNLIILTTERSLFEILNAINKKAKKNSQKAPWLLFDLESIIALEPSTATTKLYLDERIGNTKLPKSSLPNIQKFAQDFFLSNSSTTWKMITNKCPNVPDTITHAKAKGDNNLQKFNIASTYMYPAPSLYFKLLADDVFYELKHGVKMACLDEFNQSVGRNRGFRFSIGKESRVYMSSRFASDFLYFLHKHSRYKIDK